MSELTLDRRHCTPGWILVEAELGAQHGQCFTSLRIHRGAGDGIVEEVPLAAMRGGEFSELIELPADVREVTWRTPDHGQFDAARLKIRRIGRLARLARMAIRVVRAWLRLPPNLRREAGFTVAGFLRDPAQQYRRATAFRQRYPLTHQHERPGLRPAPPLLDYPGWIACFDTLDEKDVVAMRARSARFAAGPRFNLVLAAGAAGPDGVRRTLTSLHAQIFRNFTCTVLDDAGSLGASFDPAVELRGVGTGSRFVAHAAMPAWFGEFNAARGSERPESWVLLMQAGDALPAHSLYRFACEIQAHPDAVALYSDDDVIDAAGQRAWPRFKPDWSPVHCLSTHYVGAAAVLRGSAVAAAGGVTSGCCRHGNYDLLLRVIDAFGDKVIHVPAILFHRALEAHAAREDPQWCADAVRAHLARNRIEADVEPTRPGCRRVRYRLPAGSPPMISLIVPTRDALPLVRQCVDSVLAKTTYPRYEILLVDNQSTDPDTLAWFETIAVRPDLPAAIRVLRYDRPFNYSKINNFAAREARGDLLCLLNNDIEVITPDWLEEMAGQLLQPGVGVVGAKLYYPFGRVQHAGVVVGPGGYADHLHTHLWADEPGYCDRAVVAQELSAVTAACLLTPKALYQRLNGLNEDELAIAFNDIDYCLRAREAGCRVIFTPHARLYHHESASRGRDDALPKRLRVRRETAYMGRRWARRLVHDPCYNPNLSYWRPDFSLAETQRVTRDWLGK